MSSAKRPRTDDIKTEEPQDIRRSTTMWLKDGNVVLQAQDTQFRVHRTVLVMHSTVFRDRFDTVQCQEEHVVDACEIVHLSDSAQDVEHFLNALYNRSYYNKNLPFDVFEAFLRLGHKYQVIHLRDEAVTRLTTEFPVTLKKWDKPTTGKFTTLNVSEEPNPMLRLLCLAQELRLFRHIPAIFLLVAISNTLEELYNYTPHIISTDTVLQIALATEKFRKARDTNTREWLKTLSGSSCTQSRKCSVVHKQLISSYFFEVDNQLRFVNPLEVWNNELNEGLCAGCRSSAKERHAVDRFGFWRNLPVLCGLPGWNALNNFD